MKIYFQTHGCSTNFSETEVMKGLLKKESFELVSKPEDSQVIIINICTVKGEINALRDVRKVIEKFQDKKLIVAGCITPEIIPQIYEIKEDATLINTHNIDKIVEAVEETINDNHIEILTQEEKVKINHPKVREKKVVGIVPILSGCKGNCSYCSVKLVKGKLLSYASDKIINEIKTSLKDGCKEVWITSQDNAAYMLENNEKSKLADLLKQIVEIDEKFLIRVGMMNPEHTLPILDDLIEVYKNKKIFKFLHIPIQSGNDEILKSMNRNYSVDDFKLIVSKFRKEIPNITISTDIICGFPGETEEQFKDSLDFVKEIKPEVLNISKFQARPRTEAAKLKQVQGEIVKDRSKLLTDIYINIARMNNEKWIDWQGNILIDEIGKENSFVGRNLAYKPIILKEKVKLGEIVKVKIEKITSFDLRAVFQ